MLIDLHVHSSESDGSLSVEDLVAHAASQGMGAIALCDHDTTAGIERLHTAAKKNGIQAIGGVEISAEWPKGNCHIIGLGLAKRYAPLEEMLQKTRDSRDNRNQMIIDKLNENGIDITLEEVEALAGGDVVARPHMARVMVDKGQAASVQLAFDTYLAKGQKAYVDRFRLPPEEAVELLKAAGAVVVLAHPSQLHLEPREVDALAGNLKMHGLDGLEVFTPYTNDEELVVYQKVAKNQGLIVTGGSDFHGESKPEHAMGYYRSTMPIPDTCLENLKTISPNIPGNG